ncbi:MAG: hypothetical protein J0H01_28700 [Rhizobiales bacterium]|nr:hypothetical protein [Hyphomicrobiales bacterium]
MGIAIAAERRLLAEDEYDPVAASHYPALETATRAELIELAGWLRARRAKASDIVRHRRRVRRGKAEPRNTAAEISSERGVAAKKQVFAHALRRVNARIERLGTEERRSKAIGNLRAAVERKAEATKARAKPGPTAAKAMTVKENAKTKTIVEPAKTGRVSQAGKKAQAAKDARPA